MAGNLDELIARLEAAVFGSGELDEAIWAALLPCGGRTTAMLRKAPQFGDLGFSRSLDAALTLVPAKWTDIDIEIVNVGWLGVPPPRSCVMLATGDLNNPKAKQVVGRHDEPALAACIASLKARALSAQPVNQS